MDKLYVEVKTELTLFETPAVKLPRSVLASF